MKDHSQNSEFETEIPTELEARMAALVLGEASDLEADQLQRLIDARPDLAALKAQFEAVHGLLGEIGTGEIGIGEEAPQGDPWKLPAEMRGKLLAVIEGKSPQQADVSPVINPAVATGAIKPRVRWKHSRLVALLCVAGCLGMFALSGTFLLQSKTAPHETALASNRRFNAAADESPVKGFVMPQLRGGTNFSVFDSDLTDAPVASSPLQAIRESRGTETAAPDAYHLWSMQDGEQSNADTRFRYLADPKAALAEGKDSDLAGIVKRRVGGGMSSAGTASSDRLAKGGGGYGGDAASQERRLAFAEKFRSRSGSGNEPNGNFAFNSAWLGGLGGQTDGVAGRELNELSERAAGVRDDFNEPGLTRPEVAQSSEPKYSNGPEIASAERLSRGREQLAKELSGGTSSLLSPSNQTQLPLDTLSDKKLSEFVANNSAGDALFEAAAKLQTGQATSDVRLQVEKGTPLLAGKPLEFFDTEKKNDAVALGLELQLDAVAAQPKQRQPTAEQLALGNVRRGDSQGKLPELEAKPEDWFEGRAALVPVDLKETNAAAEPFSTFSLHISDVSFQLVQAALAGGKWPEANQVRIEEFVNAFDYGDPLPSQREKVACIVEQAIHPSLQQRNIMRVSLRTAATGRASHTPLRLTLVLDNSGSMERSDRQQSVRRAFALLAQQLTAQDQVTLISFARRPRLLADKVSGDKSPQLLELIQNLPSEGGTNIEAALQLAFEKAREQQVGGAQSRIVLLTDGAVNLGDANPNSLSQMITTIRDSGIAFDAAGISAEGLNDEILEALARQGDGRYYLLDSNEAADDGFARQIAGALRPSAKNVKVQIEFNPQRVGRYKLLGFEKHLLKQEDFRNDQVDAAELAAAEAGVAVYQFEAKPDGEGDVGSVSVRFQDLATGQMVENRWPIPYQADAPQLNQAAPALRMATTAALLAAKLRGDALGETIEFKTLADFVAGLPNRVRQTKRVEQLQQMIQQARQLGGN